MAERQAKSLGDLGVTIAELHDFYRDGGSPADVVRGTFQEIERVRDPGIFITLFDLDKVMGEVSALPPFDTTAYPLWGVPFAVKDNIDIAGVPTTCGCPAFAFTPQKTAHAVSKLLAAGAILIGKTNLDQFATGLVGVRTPYEVPRNAIDAALVPGGSSSGSAVAVAHGIVTFALGTDTAGSGRVPAGLNNIVGLKPSVGAVSTSGVFPACRTMDCVSVFAGTVDDAYRVFQTMAGYDEADPYSREIAVPPLPASASNLVFGIPKESQQVFHQDVHAARAFERALRVLEGMGASFRDIDMTPFNKTAELLYEGAWVAERYAAVSDFIRQHADAMVPVTRKIIESASRFSAADAFTAMYARDEFRRQIAPLWSEIDALVVPTTPCAPTLDDLRRDPIRPNSELGTYTNFVNLLDLCALAVPGPWREDRRAAGVTFIGPSGSDAQLASLGRIFHVHSGLTIGATGRPVPTPVLTPEIQTAPQGLIELAVVGAHLRGMPLNHELMNAGAVFRRAVQTEPLYRLFELPSTPVRKPALVRTSGPGHSIEVEVWALTPSAFGAFVANIPAPLGVGTLSLADGTHPMGFLGEAYATEGAEDISAFGGWRAFVESKMNSKAERSD
jgi:allophanate hydrolase